MNQEQIIAGNKLIAEFMGLTPNKSDGGKTYAIGGVIEIEGEDYASSWEMPKYHTSYDWLMPVVEKIKDIDNQAGITDMALLNIFKKEHEGEGDNIFETSIFCPIGEVYNRVIVFINWYNKQK